MLLFELNHVIPDAECTEAADKAGNAAETILLHVKGRVCLFQLIVYDAQIIHMSVISLDDADDFLFNLSLGDAGALFLDKITAVELDHLKVVVVQAFQKGGELGVAVVPDIKIWCETFLLEKSRHSTSLNQYLMCVGELNTRIVE